MIFLKSKRLGSIQQLRGPNCNQFSPPTLASSNGQLLTFYITRYSEKATKIWPIFHLQFDDTKQCQKKSRRQM